jgi:hypothetical protein
MNLRPAILDDWTPANEDGLDAGWENLLETESDFVDTCLPYAEMTSISPAYERFAREHFAALQLRGISWADACPAYALAWLTHAAYGPTLDDTSEWELRLQWQDLQGISNLNWREARALLRDAWTWLGRGEHTATGQGAR